MCQVIFVNRFFYPDHSATSQLLTDLAFDLARSGHNLCVIASRIQYDNPDIKYAAVDTVEGVQIRRVWTTSFGRGSLVGRAVDYLTFYASVFVRLLLEAKQGDLIVAKTDPPVMSVIAAIAARLKGALHINWLQDMFPEVAEVLKVPGFGLVSPGIRMLRNWSLRTAILNVAIGDVMARRIEASGVTPARIQVIHNWADGSQIQNLSRDENNLRKEWDLGGRFVVGYSGNLGRAHEYKTIVNAARQLEMYDQIVFLFIGGGAQFERLKSHVKQKGIRNIQFRPYQPRSMLRYSLTVPDVHIVSLLPKLEGLIVPSKFYGIAAAGRPTIFIGDEEGEIARILRRHKCGLTVPVNDSAALMNSITSLSGDMQLACDMGDRARKLFDERYDRTAALNVWKEVIDSQLGMKSAG